MYPVIIEEIVEVVRLIQQERIQQRTVEQTVDVPVPQVVEEMVDVLQIILLERISERIIDRIVDVPVVMQSQVRIIQTVQKKMEVPQA